MSTPTRRYENDLLRYLGLGVLIGLLALMLTVIAYTIGTHNSTTTTPAAAPPGGSTAASSGGGSSSAAKQLFVQTGCGGCHTFAAAGTNGTIGPDLAKVAAAAKADHNMSLADYIRQSITDPAAYVSAGYNAGVMPTYYATKLTPSQISQLVSYIAAGQAA
jgi:cytochrome c551/c552